METVEIKKNCMLCGGPSSVTVLKADYEKYLNGAKVQHAFPEMPADQREIIISGSHPKCFDEAFAEDEDYF